MKNIKKLNAFIIIVILIFYPLSQVRAGVPIIDTAQFQKEFILDTIAKSIARGLLKTSTNFLIRKISGSGRGGGPAFVQDWRNFILGGQHRGEDIWRGIIYMAANGNPSLGIPPLLCDHIRNSQAFKSFQPREVPNLIQSGLNRRVDSRQEYLVTARCDPVVNKKFNTFMNNFSAGGGWDTFERLLQPPNNIYGATELALEELNKQRSIEERADISEATSGRGFTSMRTGCVAREPLPPDFVGPPPPGKRCTIFGKVVTPADIIGQSAATAIDTNLKELITADEFNEVIVVLIGALLDRAFSEFGLAQGSNIQGQTLPTQPIPSIPSTPNCRVNPVDGTITCNGTGTGPSTGTGETTDGPFKVRYQLLSRDTVQITAELPGFISASNFNWIDIYVDGQLVIISEPRGSTPHSCFNSPCNYINGAPLSPGSHSYYAEAQKESISYSTKNKPGSFKINSESTPSPSPTPGGGQPASLLSDVQAERGKYGPRPSAAELGQLLNAVAWNNRAAGWGLSRKDFGNYCPSPAGSIACDILHHQPTNTLYDVLAAAGEASTPQWVLVPYHNNPNRPWVAPVQP